MDSWRKSTYSDGNGGECIELASDNGTILVRDTKNSTGPVLRLTPADWAQFTRAIKG